MSSSSAPAFDALARVYGRSVSRLFPSLHLCVVGIGGVGSWTVESLARTGIGRLTMIDHDDVTLGNVNRQIHALHSTIDAVKVETMAARVRDINPDCDVRAVDDFVASTNLDALLGDDVDVVVDAIDSIRFKAALIHHCRRRRLRIVTTGGAGGRIDPLAVTVSDLSRTWNDPLAAKVRSRLRTEYGFPNNPKRRFGVDCVYSTEQPVYPDGSGEVTQAKPGVPGVRLDCERGYGSACVVTATVGLVAASVAIRRAVDRHRRTSVDADADGL